MIYYITFMQYVIWISLIPLAPIIKYMTGHYNCWYYCYYRLLTRGGKVHWFRSNRYSGFHWVYEDTNNIHWEYTIPNMPRFTPWWELLFYKGVERRFRSFPSIS